jgi:hypothetical protein
MQGAELPTGFLEINLKVKKKKKGKAIPVTGRGGP